MTASQPSPTETSMAAVETAMDGGANGSGAATAEEEKPTPIWAYPATYLLMGINFAVFAIMSRHTPLVGYWEHHVWSKMFSTVFDLDRVLGFGGCDAQLVIDGQWWRLITATFVHITVLHLLINMWCLWNLGFFGEPLLGRRGLVAVYLLTGVAGNMLSVAWSLFTRVNSTVAGASGAVFGIAGILIILLSNRRLKVPWNELRSLRLQVAFFAIANLAFGWAPLLLPYLSPAQLARLHIDLATVPRISNAAHLGGFLSGVALGVPLFSRMLSGRPSYRRRQRVTFAVAGLILCLVGYALAKSRG